MPLVTPNQPVSYLRPRRDDSSPNTRPTAAVVPPAKNVLAQFTPRQRQVLRLLADGLSDEAIARKLALTSRSIRSDVAVIRAALNAGSRFQIGMRYAELRLSSVIERLQTHDCGCSHEQAN